MKINKSKTKELVIDLSKSEDKLPNHTYRRNRHSASNRGEDSWHYHHHHQQPDMGVHVDEITRKASKRLFLLIQLKRSGIPVEDLLTVYTTVARCTQEYACPAWSTSLTKWYGASTKMCYEHHIPEHSLCRSISECTGDFSETETCAVMQTCLHTNRRAAAQTE